MNAKLDRTLESKSAAVGQTVTARLDGTVTLGGTKLTRGTELIGKVAEVKSGNPVSVTLLFTSAKLKDGKEIPVKATLLAASPDSGAVGVSLGAAELAGHVDADGAFDQQPGALSHVAMTSAVRDHNSGTFSSTSGNFKAGSGNEPAGGNCSSERRERNQRG